VVGSRISTHNTLPCAAVCTTRVRDSLANRVKHAADGALTHTWGPPPRAIIKSDRKSRTRAWSRGVALPRRDRHRTQHTHRLCTPAYDARNARSRSPPLWTHLMTPRCPHASSMHDAPVHTEHAQPPAPRGALVQVGVTNYEWSYEQRKACFSVRPSIHRELACP